MTKKFFLFFLTAFMAVNLWAGIDDDLHQYLNDIQYNSETNALSFNDVYQNNVSMPRWYIVEA